MSHDVTIALSNGSDLYNGAQRATHAVDGNKGNDVIIGGSAGDKLDGDVGNDKLVGLDGCDVLIGGDGNDVIMGGRGSDVLAGGKGTDIFRFNATRDAGNTDYVLDWTTGDLLQLTKLAKASVSISQGDAGAEFGGADLGNDAGLADTRVDIAWAGGTYTLWLVDATVTANDLIFG